MADPNDVIFNLFCDASRFEGGVNQAQRALDKLGAVVDGSTVKLEKFVDASGNVTAKYTALTLLGDKVIVAFDKVGNSFEVTSAKIVTSSDQGVAAFDREAKAVDDLVNNYVKAEKAITDTIAKAQTERAAFEEKTFTSLTARLERLDAEKSAAIHKQAVARAIDEAEVAKKFQQQEGISGFLSQAAGGPERLTPSQDPRNKGIDNAIAEEAIHQKLSATFAKEAAERQKWADAAIKAAKDTETAEVSAANNVIAARKKANLDLQNQINARKNFEDKAAESFKKTAVTSESASADTAVEARKQSNLDIQNQINARKNFEDKAAEDLKKIIEKPSEALRKELESRKALEDSDEALRKSRLAASQRANIDKQNQINARVAFEAAAAEQLKKTFKESFADIDKQYKDRIKFEDDASKKLTAIFAKEAEDRKRIARDIAKAEFDAFAKSAKEKQDLAAKEASKPGFLSGFNKRVNPFATAEGAGSFAGSFAGNLAARGVGAGISAVKEGFQEAIAFEQSIARLQVTQRGAKLTSEQLSRSVIDLSNAFNIDRAEIVNAKINVFQNTLASTDAEANKVVEAAAKLAKLTGSSLNDSIETITTSLNAFGLKITDADKVSELLFSTFKNGGPAMKETSQVLGQIGALLSPFGAKIEDVGAILSAFNKRGLSANETLTAFVNIFTRLAAPGQDKGIKDFLGGLSLEEIVASKGVIGLLQSLADKAKTGATELSALFAQGKSGKSAVAVIGAIEDIVAQEKILKESTHDAAAALKELQDNSGEKLAKSLNQSKNAFLEFGQSLLNLKVFQDIAEAIKVAAEFNKRQKSDENDSSIVREEQIDKLRRLADTLKSLKAIGKIAPQIDVSGLPTTADQDVIDNILKERGLHGTIELSAGKTGLTREQLEILQGEQNPLAFTAIREEQERRKRIKIELDATKEKEVQATKIIQASLEDQNRAAFESFNKRLEAHRNYVETVIDQEKSLTKSINNELQTQIHRAEEGLHKIEDVAKHAADLRKKLNEEKQTRQDTFQQTQFAAAQKLETDPRRRQQNEEFRQDQLKQTATRLLNELPNLKGDDFLQSRNIDLAKSKLVEFVDLRKQARDAAIEEFTKGNITRSQLLIAEGEYIDALRIEEELLDKAAKALAEKEKRTKAIADQQKNLVEGVKDDITAVINFNPFVKKDEQAGKRGISGSREEQLAKFDTIAAHIKTAEKNLNLDQVINVDKTVKERRDQIVRDLNLEQGERGIAEKAAGFRALAENNVKGVGIPDVPEAQQAAIRTGIIEGFKVGLKDFGASLRVGEPAKAFSGLSTSVVGATKAIEDFAKRLLSPFTQDGGSLLSPGQSGFTTSSPQGVFAPSNKTIPDVGGSLLSPGQSGFPSRGRISITGERINEGPNTGATQRAQDLPDFREPTFNSNVKPKRNNVDDFFNDVKNTTVIHKMDINVSAPEADAEEVAEKVLDKFTQDERRRGPRRYQTGQ